MDKNGHTQATRRTDNNAINIKDHDNCGSEWKQVRNPALKTFRRIWPVSVYINLPAR